jgi:hypothetical protein
MDVAKTIGAMTGKWFGFALVVPAAVLLFFDRFIGSFCQSFADVLLEVFDGD